MPRSVRPRILIADSYTSQQEALSTHLRELSPAIDVLGVNEGREALSRIEAQEINLFLVNAFLKGPLNGFELCRAIRKQGAHQHTPIILILSGALLPEHRRALAAGADLLLHAPVEKQELWRMVVLLLNEAARRRKPDSAADDESEIAVIELKPSMRTLH